MLQHFFAQQAWGEPTRGLFDGLAISRRPDVLAHQGKYPVVFISFKDLRTSSFQEFQGRFRGLLASLVNEFPALPDSQRLGARDRAVLQALLEKRADPADTINSLRLLSEMLHKHYGQRVLILLDEYDTPIHNAYLHGYYPELIHFMRDLQGAALKDNPHLLKAVLTGILRVAKENLFSGLNNLKVLTVLDNAYAQYFGFTEAEVAALAQTAGLAAKHPALEANIKDWYNGYRFGGEVIYNPWSIVSCLDEKGVLKPYWLNTSGADLLKRSMERAETDFKEGLESVIRRTPVEQLVDPNLVFADLDKSSTALWSLLLFSGYLTADNVSYQEADGRARCRLRTVAQPDPNFERIACYVPGAARLVVNI